MNIVVVCAPQTFGCNTGMYSVDLAGWHFFKANLPNSNVEFISLYPHKCDFGEDSFPCVTASDYADKYRQADKIVFWGDFLHSHNYMQAMLKQLQQRGSCESEVTAMVRSFLYLSDFEDNVLHRVVVYGGTILFNPANTDQDKVYANDISRLYKLAHKVSVRDPFSAFMVNQIRGDFQYSSHGTDCAQLLSLRGLFGEKRNNTKWQYGDKTSFRMGIFIGRSHLDAKDVSNFVLLLQESILFVISWLDWGTKPFFLERKSEFFGVLPSLKDDVVTGSYPIDLLRGLSEYGFVITDTYHVCVNAWSMGIPTICIIDNTSTSIAVNQGSKYAARDKRVSFLWTYNAAPFIVYSSDLECEDRMRVKVAEIKELMMDGTLLSAIIEQMKQHVEVCEKSLLSSFS